MELNMVLNKIEDIIFNEENIDFTGIQCGEYSINEQKEMLLNAIKIGLKNE